MATLHRVREEARRLAGSAQGTAMSVGALAAMAYPDRVGLHRKGDAPRFVLSGGKGAALPEGDPMGGERLIVATDLDGDLREARIRQAARITEAELREIFPDRIAWHDICEWSRREGRVIARRQERVGALVLQERNWNDASPEAMARAMLDGVRQLGLRLPPASRRLVARAELMRRSDSAFPDFSEAHLMETLADWLLPHLAGITTAADWKAFDMTDALRARLSWDQLRALDASAPSHFETPLGRRIPIDYSDSDGTPRIALRLQEMFGVTEHPRAAGRPIRVTLLSPAQRPVQVTEDLPGFWASSYQDVRKDMRGRYPRHPWPEDPTRAGPTLRAKPRG